MKNGTHAQMAGLATHLANKRKLILKRLCELLDASLELETSPGKGSTFRVTLPRYYAVVAEK